MTALWSRFATLPHAGSGSALQFAAERIPGRLNDFIGKSAAGLPAVLIKTRPQPIEQPTTLLRHVRIASNAPCRVTTADGLATEDTFCLIECLSSEQVLQMAFVLAISGLLSHLPEVPTLADISDLIDAVVATFRPKESPSARTVRGLWAELFLISIAPDKHQLIGAWHDEGTEKFDFALETHRLEVKSSEAQLRVHDFSIDQLQAAPGNDVVIASVLLQRSASGASILDLATRLAESVRASPQHARKIWANVFGVLGEAADASASMKFDEPYSLHSIALIDGGAIPCPEIPDGAPISNVRFTVAVGAVLRKPRVKSAAVAFWERELSLHL